MAYQMFKGDYGSQLRAPDYSGIERAGQAYGEMYKGLGQAAGAAIEKYQLNKQKRDVAQQSLEGNLAYMRQNDPETLAAFQQEYAKDFATLEKDGGNAKTINNLNAGMAAWKDRLNQKVERDYKAAQTENVKSASRINTLEAELGEQTQGYMADLAHNKAYASELANQGAELDLRLKDTKDKRDRKKIKRDIELHKLRVEAAKGANRQFGDVYDSTVAEAEANAEAAKARTSLLEAQAELTKLEAVGEDIANKAAGAGKKFELAEVVTKAGSDYIWNGNTLQPLVGQLTQADRDKLAFDAFGKEVLLTYYDSTRDADGKINPDLFKSIDPNMERLLIIAGMVGYKDLARELTQGKQDELYDMLSPDRRQEFRLQQEANRAAKGTPDIKSLVELYTP